MTYKKVSIIVADPSIAEMLIALLAEAGYEGFEELDKSLIAYIGEVDFDEHSLGSIAGQFQLNYELSEVEKTNWNKEWEENFQPVMVKDFCTIRADFHHIDVQTPYEIIITPKMSFGTGHHSTTQLMMQMMRKINFKDKSVFDFGTGTGILAILASMLGARDIVAIDNDEWSIDNSIENAERNDIHNIQFKLGSIEYVAVPTFDVILANINRNILLQYMGSIFQKTSSGGLALMSGLLEEDKDIIVEQAKAEGFQFLEEDKMNKWIVLLFAKK